MKKSNDIVKVSNDINLFSFGGLTKYESDILSSTLLELFKSNGETVTLSISRLKAISKYPGSNERFVEILERAADKLLDLKVWNDDDGIEKRNIFHKYKINKERTEVQIVVIPGEQKLFKELEKAYMQYKHKEYLSLPNNYAKTLYRLCMQWDSKGKINIDVDEFRFVMGIPPGYRASEIDKRVIEPAVDALNGVLRNLKWRKIYGKREHGGGKQITAYEFTFKGRKKKNEKTQYELDIERAKELGISEDEAHKYKLQGLLGDKLHEREKDRESGIPF